MIERLLPLLLALASAAPVEAGAAAPSSPAVVAAKENDAPPQHRHEWVQKSRREWVPPKKVKQLVGYDDNGRPIYKEIEVRPGYYRDVTYLQCKGCGAKKG